MDKLIYIYFLLLPLMRLPKFGLMGEKIQYCDIVFLFLFIFWAYNFLKQKMTLILPKGIILSLLFLLAVNLISCLGSLNFSKSIIDYAGLVYLILIFLCFSSLLIKKDIFEKVILVIFLTATVAAIIGLLCLAAYSVGNNLWAKNFLLFTPKKVSVIPFPRITSVFILPEMFINFSQMGLTAGFILLSLERFAKSRKIIFIGILFIVFAAFFAYSRSLSGFFFILAGIALFNKNIKFSITLKSVLVCSSIFLVIAAIVTSNWVIYPIQIHKDKSQEVTFVSFHTSPDIRAFLRKAALDISLRYPFFGIGQGMFTGELKNYIDHTEAKKTLEINNLTGLEIDPHCAYTGTMAETGFTGFLVFMIFFYLMYRWSIASIIKSSNIEFKAVGFCLLVGIFGYLLNGLFMDIFSVRQLWLNLGLLAASNYRLNGAYE